MICFRNTIRSQLMGYCSHHSANGPTDTGPSDHKRMPTCVIYFVRVNFVDYIHFGYYIHHLNDIHKLAAYIRSVSGH